jgi:hypothetical protein
MKNHRKPLGKLSPTYKVEVQLPSVDDTLRQEQQERQRDTRNRAIESLGRGLRSILAIEESRPVSRETAHRAGLTAIGIGMVATAFMGGLTAYAITHPKEAVKCETFSTYDFGETPGAAATAVSELYADLENNDVYYSALQDFMETDTTDICAPYLYRVSDEIRDN